MFAKSYWVYLDNQGSEELARTRLAELAAKGVEDFLLNRTGDPKNAISLGLYQYPELGPGARIDVGAAGDSSRGPRTRPDP